MAGFEILNQTEEGESMLDISDRAANITDQLHFSRLLPIEERPIRRLIGRTLGQGAPFQWYMTGQPPIPPPKSEEKPIPWDPVNDGFDKPVYVNKLHKYRHVINNEFSLFDTNLVRVQLLRNANEAERSRYAAEKLEIEGKADDVRDNISSLRSQLEHAQQTLAVRKTYDVLADKVTKNPNLKPRDEQHVNIEKLKSEIEELERESQELSQTWVERRNQFAKVLDEGHRLRRQVRNEKEPVEGEEEEDQDQDEEMDGVDRNRSNIGTPRPEDAPTPLPGGRSRGTTPEVGGAATPLPETTTAEQSTNEASLKPIDEMDIS
jgi:hypothetical protein